MLVCNEQTRKTKTCKWQNRVKHCSDPHRFQMHDITGKVVIPELQYRRYSSRSDQQEGRRFFSDDCSFTFPRGSDLLADKCQNVCKKHTEANYVA